MTRFATLVVAVALGAVSFVSAAERAWEVRGEFVALKPGDPEKVVFRLADGGTVELPLETLSESSQAEIRRMAADVATAAATPGSEGVTVRGPFGRFVRVTVPEAIKSVEADAIHCRSAAEAADVYRLFLASAGLSAEQRSAAESRLREWSALADAGLVRLGDRWVAPAEAQAAAAEAKRIVDHALELMRLGNADLAEEELRKACRVDPESGRASFVMGLSYALVARNPAKAVEHLGDVVWRAPENSAALTDLAVLEMLTRRYATVVDHFRGALENAVDPQPVGDNVAWALRSAGDAKINPALAKKKIPEKTVEELNDVYRILTQDLKLAVAAAAETPQYVGPRGVPCTATTLADVAKLFGDDASSPVIRRSLGFVVAPEFVVCPRHVLEAPDGSRLEDVAIELVGDRSRRLPASVIAVPEGVAIALLKCDGLAVAPLQVAAATPEVHEVIAVDRVRDSWLAMQLTTARGRVVAPASGAETRGRFILGAVLPRGLGGGPIVDAAGRVVGMVAATPRTDQSGNAAGFGLPGEIIMSSLEKHLPDEAAGDETVDGDVAAKERRAINATVVVAATRGRPGKAAAAKGAPR